MLSFWVRRNGQEDWQPVPAEGAILEEDTYTIIARSPQPHFTITVDVRRRPLAPEPEGSAPHPSPVQTRSVRTNEDGIGIILPASHLAPGFWELHCQDADLIAELFGETEQNNCLRLQVVPASAAAKGEQETQKAELPQKERPAPPVPTELFSLMHTELEGSPDEVLVLTGRIGCSGELRVRVWQEGEPGTVFEGQRLIQFPAEARSAVFSIPITLPGHTWVRPLRGELHLTPTSWEKPAQPLTIPFSVRCRGQDQESSLSGIPAEHSQEGATPVSPSATTLLSPERTLQKLLRIWQQSVSRSKETSDPQTDPKPVPSVETQTLQPLLEDGHRPAPPPSEPQAAVLPASPAAPEPELPTQAAGPENLLLPPGAAGVCPAPQLWVPDQLRAGDNFDVVLRLPAVANSRVGESSPSVPFWIKFWVKHGRTRSLVDGPRWLLDFSRDEQGQWQALTRMTVPPGVPELIFEAWAVSPDRQQQSDRVTERRSVLP